jgi:hypothetical protein
MSKALLITGLFIIALAAAIYAPPKAITIPSFAGTTSPANTMWDGASEFTKFLNGTFRLTFLQEISDLNNYGADGEYSDVLILLGPDIEYSDDEIRDIRNFLNRGGSILIADETGSVNSLLRTLYRAEISVDKYLEYTMVLETNITPYIWIANFTYPAPYTVNVDLPSYISKLGMLKEAGSYIEIYSQDPVDEINITIYRGYAAYYQAIHRAFVIADTSLFINHYIDKSQRKDFIYSVIIWLSTGEPGSFPVGDGERRNEIRVLLDVSHYSYKTLSLPLPHMGMIIASYLSQYGEEFNRYTYDYIINTPAPLKLFIILMVGLSVYRSSRRWYVKKVESDAPIKISRERKVMVYSPELEDIKISLRRRGIYKRMIANLYEITDLILRKRVGVSIEQLIVENSGWDLISVYIGKEDRDRLRKTLKEIFDVREYLEGRRRFMFIIRWKAKFYRLANNLNVLFERLGVPLIGDKSGKGVEYWFR